MNMRYDFIVAPFKPFIEDAKVLDIASHDGRWSYALAGAGAAHVYGIEEREELIGSITRFPTRILSNASLLSTAIYIENSIG
ncbi:hypothetical protein [Planktotalea sp.]|uniref:hypothetical protein n=1 Tax=Planktotalea sp. TaxID=2029877 RepID=UPI0025DFEC0E|nr:hypothetical protein [Planktotalea sp.]